MSSNKSLCFGCFSKKDYEGPCFKCGYLHEGKESVQQAHLSAGTVLNRRYILGKLLGIGGFGITYIAFDPKLRVKLAIKEFFPRHISSRNKDTRAINPYSTTELDEFNNGLKYFLNEARSAAMFESHQNIVGVKDLFEENNTAYLVMPYISGVPFDSFLKNHGGKIDFKTALSVLAPIMNALITIHDNNLLHRDISPENIFITEDGIPKLLDFGSARPSVTNENLSMTPVIKEGFAPLEQYSRQGEQGPWTDIYSMAATFYKAVTGKIPPAAMERFGEDILIPPNSTEAQIPGYAEKALLKALSLKADDRFQHMVEFRDAITKGKKIETGIFVEKEKPAKKNIVLTAVFIFFLLFALSWSIHFLISGFKEEDKKDISESSDLLKQDEEAEINKDDLAKKETDKVEPVSKPPSKPVKRSPRPAQKAQKKTTPKPPAPEPVKTPPDHEKKGVTMRGRNYVFTDRPAEGLSPEQYYKEGFKYELVRNLKQAEAYFNEACNLKHTNACYRLGRLRKDQNILKRARDAYAVECRKGLDSSCISLADMMITGEGGAKDPALATTTLANQCSKGNVNGCYLLAQILEKGQNINRDLPKARKYYLHSCEAGSREGCMRYGEMLEGGIGGEADSEKAKKYYGIACKRGVPRACMKAN